MWAVSWNQIKNLTELLNSGTQKSLLRYFVHFFDNISLPFSGGKIRIWGPNRGWFKQWIFEIRDLKYVCFHTFPFKISKFVVLSNPPFGRRENIFTQVLEPPTWCSFFAPCRSDLVFRKLWVRYRLFLFSYFSHCFIYGELLMQIYQHLQNSPMCVFTANWVCNFISIDMCVNSKPCTARER